MVDFEVCFGSLSCCRIKSLFSFAVTHCVTLASDICWYLVESILSSVCAVSCVSGFNTMLNNWRGVIFMKSCSFSLLQTYLHLFSKCLVYTDVSLQFAHVDFSDDFARKTSFWWLFHVDPVFASNAAQWNGVPTLLCQLKPSCRYFAVQFLLCICSFLGLSDLVLTSTVPLNCHFLLTFQTVETDTLKSLDICFLAFLCFGGFIFRSLVRSAILKYEKS